MILKLGAFAYALLLCQINSASAAELCIIRPFANSQTTLYVRCPDYCCRSDANSTQYCCKTCELSVSGQDACNPEQLWRYILYVGLGVSGCVVLCYLIAYVIKNCKGPLKHSCCRQRSGRVQDPGISMTRSSASTRPPRRTAVNLGAVNDVCEEDEADADHWARHLQPPPPPAYSPMPASSDSAAQQQQQPEEEQQPPPPNYSEAAASGQTTAAPSVDEPPPAYCTTVSMMEADDVAAVGTNN